MTEIINDTEISKAAAGKVLLEKSGDKIIVDNINNSSSYNISAEGNNIRSYFVISNNGNEYSDFASLKKALINELDKTDMRKDEEIELDEAKASLEKRLEDKEFQEYLSQLNLEINLIPRDEIDYYYYDVFYKDGKKLGSFAILKKLGEIYLIDSDDVPVSSLKTLSVREQLSAGNTSQLIIPENIPQIDGLYSDSNSITFLLVGNHEKNTDTMILVHADKTNNTAHLIGIPRDLYWKSRKINSIYLNYGAEQFKKELSEITGLEISHYIVVDMYAFIDIVNILGGIEVTLEEDLVDPTYKTRDNGEWSTLNYKKGTYNLNGIEALRVARSRHGSNDFERSKRQQLIIEAFFQKVQSLGVTDLNKVYAMIDAIFEYVETDFSLIEILGLYNEYSDISIDGKHVLSFDNILYDTYSNTYMLNEEELKDVGPDYNKGAWILFPRNNDWNNIRWYVRGILNGELE